MRYSHRRRIIRNRIIIGVFAVVVLGGGTWWYRAHRKPAATPAEPTLPAAQPLAMQTPTPQDSAPQNPAPRPVAVSPRPTEQPSPSDATHTLAADAAPTPPPTVTVPPAPVTPAAPQDTTPAVATAEDGASAPRASNDLRTGNSAIETARKLNDAGQVLEARQRLNALLVQPLSETEETEVRTQLRRIADDCVFGPRNIPGDPLVEQYTIQSGDRLVNVGRKFDVPTEIVQTINQIPDARTIRANQRLKIPRGPFNVRIHKSKFRLDVYLGDVYVRSYRVGLGSENGTPEGVWRVKNRLLNPTYYPPASATSKQIIAAGDPANPLGGHWIGLEGVEGAAVGREGYGIHGTIEPESIGRAVSMGCVRMRNEDVAFVYQLLLPGRSTVTIEP